MGSLVGAALAAGLSAEAMEREYLQTRMRELLLRPRLRDAGLIDPAPVEALLRRLYGTRRLEELERPFAVVAISLGTLQPMVIRSGPLVDAVMASIAIPLAFPPRRLGDDYFIDGGLVEPVPTAVAEALGARTVVALDADIHAAHPLRDTPLGPLARRAISPLVPTAEGVPTRRWVLRRLVELMADAPRQPPRADLLIQPAFGRMTANDFHRGRHCIACGEAAARHALPRLSALVAREPAPAADPAA
jgi:NTE family protein